MAEPPLLFHRKWDSEAQRQDTIACPWARALSSSALCSKSQNTEPQWERPEQFSGQISMFSFAIVCLARPATTLLLLFIVYLTSTFDYSLCRQKLVFVFYLQVSFLLPLTMPQGHCRLLAEVLHSGTNSLHHQLLSSTPRVTGRLHTQQCDPKRRDRVTSPGLPSHL